MAIGYGSSIITKGAMFIVDIANAKCVSGSNTVEALSSDTNYHYGTPTIVNNGLVCNESQFIAVDNSTHNADRNTVSVVYRRDSAGSGEDIVINKENSWEIRDDGGALQWAIYTSNQAWFWYNTGVTISVGETAYIAITYDGTYIKTYKNGVLANTYTYPANGTLVSNSSYWKFNSRHATKTTIQNPGNHTLFHWVNYNKPLTGAEIEYNFKVLKERFNL